ncbi:hypothetical protein [Sporofaciens musculi]|jgi:hypothetical protein|uniref:hypothetical protein n=1 Tax=Sporofaciens musculi TaxID=2681861 RepID=UPI002586FF1C|nr:hypothetical protein [Sporofaciens musculi]
MEHENNMFIRLFMEKAMSIFYITQTGEEKKLKNKISISDYVKKYGMISDSKVVSELNRNSAIALYDCNWKLYYNLVFIINIYVYAISDEIESYCEFNGSTKMLSSENSFWITNEVEYKIETSMPISIESIITLVSNKDFCFSGILSQTSFERYYKYMQGFHFEYIDILGKKNWRRPMALKHKKLLKTEPILKRHVNLLPFSEDALDKYINSLFDVSLPVVRQKLDSFYKKKNRLICIDINRGTIFGVSDSVSVPLSPKRRNLNQIEIEYWSTIIPSSNVDKMNDMEAIDYDIFFDLIDYIKENIGVSYKTPGCMKTEWLEE